MRVGFAKNLSVSFAAMILAGVLPLEARAGSRAELPPLTLDWTVTTDVDCVSPFDPRVRARVTSHSGGAAGATNRVSILQDRVFIASDTGVSVTYGPTGTEYAGARISLFLKQLPGGRIRGTITDRLGQIPVSGFDCSVLR